MPSVNIAPQIIGPVVPDYLLGLGIKPDRPAAAGLISVIASSLTLSAAAEFCDPRLEIPRDTGLLAAAHSLVARKTAASSTNNPATSPAILRKLFRRPILCIRTHSR